MSWSLARMARYVKQSKYFQQLKDHEDVCNQAFEKGSYLLFCDNKPFLTENKDSKNPFRSVINWRSFNEVESFNPSVKKSSIVLSVDGDAEMIPFFACSVPSEAEETVQTTYNGRFSDMRRAIFSLSDEHNLLVCRGYSMLTWNEAVQFCSHCGSALERKASGCSKECSKKCKHMTIYPQINPVAITRVTNHSNDKILLVRQPMYPKGMYSCIAGFMEPGEALEDTIRREIAEEAGIVVENIQYFESQPWPLPQTSLMMGCTAVAMQGSEELDIDKEELESAKWFTKDEVAAAVERVRKNPRILSDNEKGDLVIPPHGAIAHQLVRNWLQQYTPARL